MKLSDYRPGLPVYVTESQDKRGVTVGSVFSEGESKQKVYKCRVEIKGALRVIPIRRLEIKQGVAA